MKIVSFNHNKLEELPLKLTVSFEKMFLLFNKYASEEFKNHPYHASAHLMVAEIEKYPELIEGFSDFSLLEKYKDQIDLLLEPLFPEPLLLNEIKAATIPFSFISFKFTTRFENILKNAGDNYEFTISNFDDDLMYIHACTMILGIVYNYHIDLKKPFFFDIPNEKSGILMNYRAAFNGDFMDIIATENAPKITEEDYKLLLDNFDNIDIWKEKFPPNSYIFKGFGIMNLFDVTTDATLSKISNDLLRGGDDLILDLEGHLRGFFNIKDLKIGYSVFDGDTKNLHLARVRESVSLILPEEQEASSSCNGFFCDNIIESVFKNSNTIAISDVEKYGRLTNYNHFYKQLKANNVGSIILLPIKASEGADLAILEIASPRPYELNSINQSKLTNLLPVLRSAVERKSKEHLNILEATIQEHYTSIHPSVKWRFSKAAEAHQRALLNKEENIELEEIVFKDVYPLFGQSDIKGSSIARNIAIKDDLITQLSLAINVLNEACKFEKLPIYDELIFRIKEYLNRVKKGLNAGDEIGILDFLKQDIYPIFNHIKKINNPLSKLVDVYINRLDKDLKVVYEKRKEYENSVTLLNDKLANFIDTKQDEAQAMYPHYFERYKTDGVEYNMYIGKSLVENRDYNDIYLYNLRLWQLQLMCEMENVVYNLKDKMEHQLEIASLVLVHSNPLAIRFRMDEKQFDVDGAYNIRYEIIKKRIDKSHIKGTNERITVPGKIAIIYSQEKDAIEYMKYIKYLQSKKYLLATVEKLDIEDLQGITGLKALRVAVNYKNPSQEKITMNDLMNVIKSENLN
ncbi:MAG: GAF domain-containing protein [Lutibacter sp.]|nr:MAG: GAF domain-containing protein [Lutibacter sp.]